MKKQVDLKKMALAGLSSGLLITAQLAADEKATKNATEQEASDDANSGNLGYHLMTEDELMLELNQEGIDMYKSLSPEGKALALQVASMRCGKTNLCKGLNACQTETNSCAGKGSCKGKGKCAFGDKNLAVKIVKEKMDKMGAKRSAAATPQ